MFCYPDFCLNLNVRLLFFENGLFLLDFQDIQEIQEVGKVVRNGNDSY